MPAARLSSRITRSTCSSRAATTVVASANLGKPAPDADGMIRLDFVALLNASLSAGVVYETVVAAVGPGGAADAPRSNTFSFSAAVRPVHFAR